MNCCALTEANVFIASPGPEQGGRVPPTNFTTVSQPLIAEPLSNNAGFFAVASDNYPPPGSQTDVFFGGDTPSGGTGQATTPIFTKQIFGPDDFPILLEGEFYSRERIGDYNELYFWIGPADYFMYSAYFDVPVEHREGILIGKFPYETMVQNGNTSIGAPTTAVQVTHDLASSKEWFDYRVVLDRRDNEVIVVEVTINGNCIFTEQVSAGNVSWLNRYRLALCADDLARNFRITTNYGKRPPEFHVSDSLICAGGCIRIEGWVNDTTVNLLCSADNLLEWRFPGSQSAGGFQVPPAIICYDSPGDYNISLSSTGSTLNRIISVRGNLDVDLGKDTSICEGASLTLELSEFASSDIRWWDGLVSNRRTISQSGRYIAESIGRCGSDQDTIEIVVESSDISLTPGFDTITCAKDSLKLNAFHPGISTYLWSTGDTIPDITIAEPGSYSVTVSNNCQTRSEEWMLNTISCCDVYIPNAFSPNDDGINDIFMVLSGGERCSAIEDFKLSIYGRWGNLVFESSAFENGWDGFSGNERMMSGVYVYIVSYREGSNAEEFSGSLSLIR